MNVTRSYHPDGSRCADVLSCAATIHTTIPPVCGAPAGDGTADGEQTCDLASGHPGPHVHAATGRQYGAGADLALAGPAG